jgi:hypothetical protein
MLDVARVLARSRLSRAGDAHSSASRVRLAQLPRLARTLASRCRTPSLAPSRASLAHASRGSRDPRASGSRGPLARLAPPLRAPLAARVIARLGATDEPGATPHHRAAIATRDAAPTSFWARHQRRNACPAGSSLAPAAGLPGSRRSAARRRADTPLRVPERLAGRCTSRSSTARRVALRRRVPSPRAVARRRSRLRAPRSHTLLAALATRALPVTRGPFARLAPRLRERLSRSAR